MTVTDSTSRNGKILVVDDHADLAENIAEILQLAGHQTIIATSAEAALELIGREDVTALVTDYRLPGRSGADLIRELRRRGSSIPAVVMSAYTDEDTIGHAEGAGAFDVLAKPVNVARLMALVEQIGREGSVVLIVDDNQPLAENLAEALRSRGYHTEVSASAAEAIGRRLPVRAAVIDYRLPDATGVEVAERLRARDPRTRILFVSGHHQELLARIGALDTRPETMEKPVNVPQLIEWVSQAFGHGPAERPDR
jgi:DNA-binding NtrC family response regulator